MFEPISGLLALEDGRMFPCRSFTGPGECAGEIVFNTGMTGYQEILTDPSYRGQLVTMTYPLIGNYGVNTEDVESDRIQASGFLIKEYQDHPSNFRSSGTLADYLAAQGVLGMEGIDTRALTLHIRSLGAMRAVASTTDLNPASLVKKAKGIPSMAGCDLVTGVTTSKPYFWVHDRPVFMEQEESVLDKSAWGSKDAQFRVVSFDYGIKYNILRSLKKVGCKVLVLPASTPASTVHALEPDGIFLSNGPGDPEPVTYAVNTIRSLLGYRPIFGICLGHQLLSLALGGRTYKLKFGHRGSNQPVKNLLSGRVEITAQNHGFAVDAESLEDGETQITHINLNDDTVEGFCHRRLSILAVQYHPEASPGPHDTGYLLDAFKEMMTRI